MQLVTCYPGTVFSVARTMASPPRPTTEWFWTETTTFGQNRVFGYPPGGNVLLAIIVMFLWLDGVAQGERYPTLHPSSKKFQKFYKSFQDSYSGWMKLSLNLLREFSVIDSSCYLYLQTNFTIKKQNLILVSTSPCFDVQLSPYCAHTYQWTPFFWILIYSKKVHSHATASPCCRTSSPVSL